MCNAKPLVEKELHALIVTNHFAPKELARKDLMHDIFFRYFDDFNCDHHTTSQHHTKSKARKRPIFKKGKKNDPNNYRPISVIPAVAKIFEKVIFEQLYNYFNINRLLTHCHAVWI
jgi:hypothetical protein